MAVVGLAIGLAASTSQPAAADEQRSTASAESRNNTIRTFFPDGKTQELLAFPEVDWDSAIESQFLETISTGWIDGLQFPDLSPGGFRSAAGKRANGADGQFISEVVYQGEGNKQLVVTSWTPTSQLLVSLPGGPTHEAKSAHLNGSEIITITPTDNVTERRGLYRAFISQGNHVHLIDGIDFNEQDDFYALVAQFVGKE